jgi:hypothetical protein
VDQPESPLFEALMRGVGGAAIGIAIAILCLAIGAVRGVIVLLSGSRLDFRGLWPLLGLYVLGFAVGGAVTGVLWPSQPVRWRQYLAGMLGGVVVLSAIARAEEGPSVGWPLHVYVMIVGLGILFGGALVRGLRSGPAV